MKIKVLFDTEATGALSGFGKYGRELLSRLSKYDDLEIAELASFGSMYDGKYIHAVKSKWRYYPNEVLPNDPRKKELESNPKNKFGGWRFDRVLMDFKPDIVVSWRDPWMMEHIIRSPLRPFFHAVLMPTVDSVPQQYEWMEMFRDADAVFTYEDWAIPQIQKQTANQANVIESCYCGVDLQTFKPQNQKECRKRLGLPEDCYIVGMVARNQIRKLYPELFKAFRIFLDKYEKKLNKKVYLLLHTSFPDAGWDLPEHLNESGIGNRVFFSTKCQQSGHIQAIPFQGTKLYSQYSEGLTRYYPNVGHGFSEEELAVVYGCMDLYIQYANCEGAGIPMYEAAACGIPIAANYYSAMADAVDKTNGIKLEPGAIPRDFQMKADRVAPDNENTAYEIYKFFNLNDSYKEKKSKQARKAAETHFNWEVTTAKWLRYFRNAQFTGLQRQWNHPRICLDETMPKVPDNLPNLQFVDWCITNLAKSPELTSKHFGLRLLHGLNTGLPGYPDRKKIVEICMQLGQNKIIADKFRCGELQMGQEDFIEFAHVIRNSK